MAVVGPLNDVLTAGSVRVQHGYATQPAGDRPQPDPDASAVHAKLRSLRARVATMLLDEGVFEGHRVLSAAAIREMQTPQNLMSRPLKGRSSMSADARGRFFGRYLVYLVVAVPAALSHNLLHEATHYLFATAFGEQIDAFRFLTNGWGTSQVVFAVPPEQRFGVHWIVIAWTPSFVTTMIGYALYALRARLFSHPAARLAQLYAGFFFLLIDPLYVSLLSLMVGGDVQAVAAIGWPQWPIQLFAGVILLVNWKLFHRWQYEHSIWGGSPTNVRAAAQGVDTAAGGIMKGAVLDWAARRGYVVAWGPAGLLEIVRRDLGERERSGEIDPAFARGSLSFECDNQPADWRVLVVAVPRPAHLVGFTVKGRRFEAVMPPTYERYLPTFEDVRRDLGQGVLPDYSAKVTRAPLKLLAARLGLVRYGRNNLTYAPGIGSYLQLLGYLTDAPLPVASDWAPSEPLLLDECRACGICEALCPTGAIGKDRVLLRAERCLTLANETAGAWPAHVPPESHHCLIGCLLCQRHCPVNPELPMIDTGVVFTDTETSALLSGGNRTDPAWDGIRAKLEALGQPYQEDVLGRNLRALLCATQRGQAQQKYSLPDSWPHGHHGGTRTA